MAKRDEGVLMTTISSTAPGRVRAWVMAARPATLPAAVAPVLVGTAVAGPPRPLPPPPVPAAPGGAALGPIRAHLSHHPLCYHKRAHPTAPPGPPPGVP